VVFAISGDLPFGSLTAPGAGMLPKLAAGLMIAFAAIILAGRASAPLGSIDWSDWKHAALLVFITATATLAYRPLGFLLTMSLLVFLLLVIVERRGFLRAGTYAIGLTLFAYWLFGKALKSPLERGLLWF
jgi:hypothetical protein